VLRLQYGPAALSVRALGYVDVEIDFRKMAEIARRNAVTFAGAVRTSSLFRATPRGPITVTARSSGFPARLGGRTLAAIVEHIGQSVAAAPRAVRFCYVFPEIEDVFFASGWLTRSNTVRRLLHPTASFWPNEPRRTDIA
jgi:hypothetical protein